jgi:putative chitinase
MNLSNVLVQLGISPEWEQALNQVFAKYDISTPARQACFIGQCMHESNNFKTLEENLNYSAKGLMATWPSRFDAAEAARCERKPELIANKVYAGRMGNTEDGEGYKFRGRGLKQLTGKENYNNCGSAIGEDLIEHPDLLLTMKYAALSAGWFWNKKNLNALADLNDIEQMTKRINGGLIGLAERKAKIAKALLVIQNND